MDQLRGRTAIVTGGGSNVGRAVARRFARAGARVVVAGRDAQRLEQTVRTIARDGAEARAVPTDATDYRQVEALVAATLDIFGDIDVLAAFAGGGSVPGAIDEIAPGVFDAKACLACRATCRAPWPWIASKVAFPLAT